MRSVFSSKPYGVILNYNCIINIIQTNGHTKGFDEDITKSL